MDEHELRTLALGLPEAVEQDHHGFPSFRVRGKIFVTLPDPGHAHLMVGEEDIAAAVAEFPGWCGEKWWGRRLAAVRVTLGAADREALAELVADAWRHKAPVTLSRAYPDL